MKNEDPSTGRRIHLKAWALASAVSCAALSSACVAQPQPNAFASSSRATDWLAKSVCADDSDRATSADPYYACPAGTHLRKIKIGEAPPYHNMVLAGNMWTDSFILSDSQGRPLYFRTFDWGPSFGHFSNNVDGFDSYAIDGRYVAIDATKAGDAAGVAFFGGGCTRTDAWISYPTRDFLNGGTSHTQIGGTYWEQAGSSFPGACPAKYAPLETDWRIVRGFSFGGARGQPVKRMDTLISYHDFKNDPAFLKSGHMEVYYFTQQYGLTRWEFWTPAQQGVKPTTDCLVPPTANFNGVTFVVQNCTDASHVVPPRPTDDEAWPLPQANVLNDGHITQLHPGAGGGGWGVWSATRGAQPNVQAGNSQAAGDTKFVKTGVRETVLDCRSQPNCGVLSQDVPANKVPGGVYLYGASVRTSPGTEGDFRVALQGLAANGQVLWTDAFTLPIKAYNGSHTGAEAAKETQSVYSSTAFPHKVIQIPSTPGVVTYRLQLMAVGQARYEVTEGWLNRFPDGWTGPMGKPAL